MKTTLPYAVAATVFSVTACASGGYTSATLVYAEPAEHVYVVPVDRVVVVSRDVLVDRGWVVYRVQRSGRDRIVWARRGDTEVLRIFVTPDGERVVVRGLREEREWEEHRRGHKKWKKRGPPTEIIAAIDIRLRGR
jgi:hypothetical protein